MTVTLVRAIETWVGLAADTKPTSPPAGSSFLALDTGGKYVYDGSAWNLVPTPVTSAGAALSGAAIYTNFGVAAKAFIKASAGTLTRAVFINRNATVRYGQIHNKATAPAGADVPIISLPIPAGTTNIPGVLVVEIPEGQAFATGIGFAVSTTESTFTDSATATDHSVHVWYA